MAVESRFADITIAICSEFRSKKDYAFQQPSSLIEIKTGIKIEIEHTPEIGVTPVEKVTTGDLQKIITKKEKKAEQIVIPVIRPRVIEAVPAAEDEEIPFAERYNLTYNPRYDFLILRKLYQPYTKKGLIYSIVIHLFFIFLMYLFIVPKDEEQNSGSQQRIVVVEDLNMPKFDPPDVDKMKEDELKAKEDALKKDVRPEITPKKITPRINRPKTTEDVDTTKLATIDSGITRSDTSLTSKILDTTRYIIPDSLRTTFSENEVGLFMAYDKTEWNLIDSRTINQNKNFTGVILGIDSTKEDFKGVTIIIIIDDPVNPKYNKNTYKNIFMMDDSTVIAYTTDQIKLSGKKLEYKYYLFTDPTGQKNIQINVEFLNDVMAEKYKKIVDAIIRTIKIVTPPPKTDK